MPNDPPRSLSGSMLSGLKGMDLDLRELVSRGKNDLLAFIQNMQSAPVGPTHPLIGMIGSGALGARPLGTVQVMKRIRELGLEEALRKRVSAAPEFKAIANVSSSSADVPRAATIENQARELLKEQQANDLIHYIYHTTARDNVGDIAAAGLLPRRPSFRGEQDFWPKPMSKSGREGRVYFGPSEEAVQPFSEPGHTTLRVRRDFAEKLGLTEEFRDRDVFTRKKIPPQYIEAKQPDGSWKPLTQPAVQ